MMSLAVAVSSLLHMVPIRDATKHEFPFAVGYLADTYNFEVTYSGIVLSHSLNIFTTKDKKKSITFITTCKK